MNIGFDIISDLNLSPNSPFDWEGKATSLYCIVAGNVSTDLKTISDALTNLGHFYQGVFYIPGSLEYDGVENYDARTKDLVRLCRKLKNTAFLHHHVVIIDGVAVLACTGWTGDKNRSNHDDELQQLQIDDLHYLKNSIEKLQKHLDVKKIIVISNAVPHPDLYFGEIPKITEIEIPLTITLTADTMKKVSHWVFGNHEKIVDTVQDNINYVNNPCFNKSPYWPKRIAIEV